MESNNSPTHVFKISAQEQNLRLDHFLSSMLPHHSRTACQRLIKENHVKINDQSTKASALLKVDDTVFVYLPAVQPLYSTHYSTERSEQLKKLTVEIIHTDTDFLIIRKPFGLMTHKPSPYNTEITLVDWLLYYAQELALVGNPERPAIVHRLDKDTSGLMIIPKNNYAHTLFGEMFKNRVIKKTYVALVNGHPDPVGVIDIPVGRDPINRNQRTTYGIEPREAITTYKILHYFNNHALVEVYPQTGRTHQIRVHFKAIGHPLVADSLYGNPSSLLTRHALHASGLHFTYNNTIFNFTDPIAPDMQQLINTLSEK